MQWKTVRIFISSTFNDMHAERDFLVKYVFPELSAWCRERKLSLVDIDLRWGVSAADSMANNTVMACLNNIDESRPFFLCFLGQRRGWIPEAGDVSGTTYESYPGIREHVGSRSVTEMEIEHALLHPMLRLVNGTGFTPKPVDHALFFFRSNPFSDWTLNAVQRGIYTNEAAADPLRADRELFEFKEKVRSQWNVLDYQCRWDPATVSPELLTEGTGASAGRLMDFTVGGLPLMDVILAELKQEIQNEFPDNCSAVMQSALTTELEQQEQFIIQCSEGFIPRVKDLDALNAYVKSQSRKPFIVTAKAGLGKTTLLANFVLHADYKGKCTARFCGASDLSSSQFGLWKSIFDENGVPFKEDLEAIKREIYDLLSHLSGVLVLDGIDQLPEGDAMLSWLPRELPEGLKLIVSLKEDAHARPAIDAASQFAIVHRIEPFSSFEDKISLINEYLKRYLKSLDEQHIRVICEAAGSENPLFLKIVLSSLRVFGAFKQLESEIAAFGEDPVEAFDAVLNNLEQDTSYITMLPGETCVPLLFGLLACARRGLTEEELLFCFSREFPDADEETIRSALRVYLRRVRPFTASRQGRVDFLYESFRQAAGRRYQKNTTRNHRLLSACFASVCDPEGTGAYRPEEQRALTEIVYHLCRWDVSLCEALLCNCVYLNARCSACGSGELISDYDLLPGLNSQTEKFRSHLIRFSDTFTKYKNSFLSTALCCDLAEAWDVIKGTGIPEPYILPERVMLPPFTKTSGSALGIPLKITASCQLDKTVAVCVPQNAAFALFSEGIGRLRMIDTDTMTVDEKVITTRPKRPMDLFASQSGDQIAVTFEDGTAEIIELSFHEGRFAASQCTASFDYYLPMLSDAVFAFHHDGLWYQKDMQTIAKRSKDGEELLLPLPSEGDVTAFAGSGGPGFLALRTMHGAELCRIDQEKIQAIGAFPDNEILGAVVLKSGDLAVSLSDATIRLLDDSGEEKARIRTGMSCALLLEVEQGLFCIAESRHNAFLWDLKDSLLAGEFPELEYNRKVSASYDGNVIHIISDQQVLTASITEDYKGSAILLSVFFHEDDPVMAYRESPQTIAIKRGEQATAVSLESEKLSFLKVETDLLIFDETGNLAIVDLICMTVQRGAAEFRPVSFAQAKGGYYCADTAGFLHHYPNAGRLPSLSGYALSSISLRVFDDILVLTGISTNAKAGNDNTPYLMLLYKIGEDCSLALLGERYFPKGKGMFMDCCFREADRRLYVFFSTPHSGSTVTLPTVSYGTVEEFQNRREQQRELYFDRRYSSFSVSDSTVLTCGGGVICAYDADSFNYLASVASFGGFRRLTKKDRNNLFAQSGSFDLYLITTKQ